MAKAKKAAKKPAKKTVAKKAVKKPAARKTAAKKPAAKKPAARKVTAKKAASAPAKVASTPLKTKQTQAQILADIAANAGVDRKQAKAVLEALKLQAKRHLGRNGSGEMMIPGLGVKLKTVKKPARKARKGINPFTGEEMMFKAKPASKSVRASALKALKEMAS